MGGAAREHCGPLPRESDTHGATADTNVRQGKRSTASRPRSRRRNARLCTPRTATGEHSPRSAFQRAPARRQTAESGRFDEGLAARRIPARRRRHQCACKSGSADPSACATDPDCACAPARERRPAHARAVQEGGQQAARAYAARPDDVEGRPALKPDRSPDSRRIACRASRPTASLSRRHLPPRTQRPGGSASPCPRSTVVWSRPSVGADPSPRPASSTRPGAQARTSRRSCTLTHSSAALSAQHRTAPTRCADRRRAGLARPALIPSRAESFSRAVPERCSAADRARRVRSERFYRAVETPSVHCRSSSVATIASSNATRTRCGPASAPWRLPFLPLLPALSDDAKGTHILRGAIQARATCASDSRARRAASSVNRRRAGAHADSAPRALDLGRSRQHRGTLVHPPDACPSARPLPSRINGKGRAATRLAPDYRPASPSTRRASQNATSLSLGLVVSDGIPLSMGTRPQHQTARFSRSGRTAAGILSQPAAEPGVEENTVSAADELRLKQGSRPRWEPDAPLSRMDDSATHWARSRFGRS